MKTLKLNFAMLAMLVAVTAAFAFKPASQKLTDPAWQYNSGPETAGNSYTPLTTAVCEGDDDICGVIAPEDPGNPGHPALSTTLQGRIERKDISEQDVFLKN